MGKVLKLQPEIEDCFNDWYHIQQRHTPQRVPLNTRCTHYTVQVTVLYYLQASVHYDEGTRFGSCIPGQGKPSASFSSKLRCCGTAMYTEPLFCWCGGYYCQPSTPQRLARWILIVLTDIASTGKICRSTRNKNAAFYMFTPYRMFFFLICPTLLCELPYLSDRCQTCQLSHMLAKRNKSNDSLQPYYKANTLPRYRRYQFLFHDDPIQSPLELVKRNAASNEYFSLGKDFQRRKYKVHKRHSSS